MIVKKVLLAASAAALMSTPAWALPSQAPSNQGTANAPTTTPVGPPSTTPNNTDNPGSANRSHHDNGGKGAGHKGDHGSGHPGQPSKPSHPGNSHKCKPHSVGYVASGTLVSQKLTKNADGTYSGELEVNVTHTNHHAMGDKGTVKYTVEKVHVTFGLADTNSDGSVGLDDLKEGKEGSRVKVIGKITKLAKKCPTGEFKPTTTVRRIVFHAPAVG